VGGRGDRLVAELDCGAVKTISWSKFGVDSPRADGSLAVTG
jgi:hypothetical protein